MNDSDSHIQLKDGMVVAIGQETLHIEQVSASDGLLTKWNGQSVLNKSNGSFHLDGFIGVEGEDNPLLTGTLPLQTLRVWSTPTKSYTICSSMPKERCQHSLSALDYQL